MLLETDSQEVQQVSALLVYSISADSEQHEHLLKGLNIPASCLEQLSQEKHSLELLALLNAVHNSATLDSASPLLLLQLLADLSTQVSTTQVPIFGSAMTRISNGWHSFGPLVALYLEPEHSLILSVDAEDPATRYMTSRICSAGRINPATLFIVVLQGVSLEPISSLHETNPAPLYPFLASLSDSVTGHNHDYHSTPTITPEIFMPMPEESSTVAVPAISTAETLPTNYLSRLLASIELGADIIALAYTNTSTVKAQTKQLQFHYTHFWATQSVLSACGFNLPDLEYCRTPAKLSKQESLGLLSVPCPSGNGIVTVSNVLSHFQWNIATFLKKQCNYTWAVTIANRDKQGRFSARNSSKQFIGC